MSGHCMSAAGPCPTLCTPCSESYQRYVAEAQRIAIERAIYVLRAHGYTVIEPEEIKQ